MKPRETVKYLMGRVYVMAHIEKFYEITLFKAFWFGQKAGSQNIVP